MKRELLASLAALALSSACSATPRANDAGPSAQQGLGESFGRAHGDGSSEFYDRLSENRLPSGMHLNPEIGQAVNRRATLVGIGDSETARDGREQERPLFTVVKSGP